MTTRAIHKIVLVGIIAALALIAWGLMRSSSLEEQTLLPTLSFDDSADRIEISGETKTTMLVKENVSWKVKEDDILFPGDSAAIESVVKILSNVELQDVVSKNTARYAVLGFEEVGVFSVAWFEGENKKGSVDIGGMDYARGGDYVRIGEDGFVYLTKNSVRSIFARGSFKDVRLVSVSDSALVSKVALEYPDAASLLTLVKKKKDDGGEEWAFKQESAVPVNQDALQTFASVLSSLRASDLIKRDAAVEYGFGQPALVVRATVDGAETVVTIGGKTSDSSSYYARVSGTDEWVYLLSSSTVDDQLMKRRADFKKRDDSGLK